MLDRRRHPRRDRGQIVVGGEDISDYNDKQLTKFRQESVGFVFQSVNLVPFLNARENLLVVDELGRRTGAPAKRAPISCSRSWGWPTGRRTCRHSSPAVNVSGSRSGGR